MFPAKRLAHIQTSLRWVAKTPVNIMDSKPAESKSERDNKCRCATCQRGVYHEDPPTNYTQMTDYDECLFYQQELNYKLSYDIISKRDYENEMQICMIVIRAWEDIHQRRKTRNETTYDELYQENIGYWEQEQLKMEKKMQG